MVSVAFLLDAAEMITRDGAAGRKPTLSPAVAEAIAIASTGLAKVAKELVLAAYEREVMLEQMRIRAVERVERTKASVPLLLTQLDSLTRRQDRLLDQLFEMQRNSDGSNQAELARLERILADQSARTNDALALLLVL